MEPLPAEPFSIEYQTPQISSLRPFIRLMAAAAMAKGVSSVMTPLWIMLYRARRADLTPNVLPTLVGMSLAIAGWFCWRMNVHACRIIVWVSGISVILAVVTTVVQFANFSGGSPALRSIIVFSAANLLGTLVLPVTIWAFFRRPEVAEVMTREKYL